MASSADVLGWRTPTSKRTCQAMGVERGFAGTEYGDPDKPEESAFLSKYAPYQNVKADGKDPRILFTTSTRDDRVHPAHARKMFAKMKDQGHDVLYYENTEGGHAGAANNEQRAKMAALEYTFLWKMLK